MTAAGTAGVLTADRLLTQADTPARQSHPTWTLSVVVASPAEGAQESLGSPRHRSKVDRELRLSALHDAALRHSVHAEAAADPAMTPPEESSPLLPPGGDDASIDSTALGVNSVSSILEVLSAARPPVQLA
eukprot:CAMPEP_0115829186 /NCGR_PEP_ID=MMETSP0287-20121206/967_1 /TAXON_ID=412157 /ORGANISM="Chrysochromulina rotalis, Strain UIO044" /LENGTH=130 /DNA_ID=CAMNT_0003282441 /DNA_START=328 /DNA_END=717 /DNA_ORIENTATION=+